MGSSAYFVEREKRRRRSDKEQKNQRAEVSKSRISKE